MELNGDLEMLKGKYLFTYQKVIRRPFDVEPGGTISWTGNPFDPKLNFDVLYKLRTSVFPLLVGENSTDNEEVYRMPKQMFSVKLNIGGTPSKTEINSTISCPKTDGNINNSDIESAIANINLDKGQQNTQAFSLILFGGFVSQNLGSSGFQLLDVSGNIIF